MHYYIFDASKLSLADSEKMAVDLSGLLSEFNLTGEVGKVTTLRSVSELVETAAQRGAKTLVACGTDDTFNQMLAALGTREFILGFVPLQHEPSALSKILGLDSLATAVKTLAARRIETIDIAKVGEQHFISTLEFGVLSQKLSSTSWLQTIKILTGATTRLQVRVDGSYTVEMECLGGIVINSRSTSSKRAVVASPTDGLLDLLVLEKLSYSQVLRYRSAILDNRLEELPHPTVIKCKQVDFLQPRGYSLTIGGRLITKFPATVEMLERKQKLIVGKNRTF